MIIKLLVLFGIIKRAVPILQLCVMYINMISKRQRTIFIDVALSNTMPFKRPVHWFHLVNHPSELLITPWSNSSLLIPLWINSIELITDYMHRAVIRMKREYPIVQRVFPVKRGFKIDQKVNYCANLFPSSFLLQHEYSVKITHSWQHFNTHFSSEQSLAPEVNQLI